MQLNRNQCLLCIMNTYKLTAKLTRKGKSIKYSPYKQHWYISLDGGRTAENRSTITTTLPIETDYV